MRVRITDAALVDFEIGKYNTALFPVTEECWQSSVSADPEQREMSSADQFSARIRSRRLWCRKAARTDLPLPALPQTNRGGIGSDFTTIGL